MLKTTVSVSKMDDVTMREVLPLTVVAVVAAVVSDLEDGSVFA